MPGCDTTPHEPGDDEAWKKPIIAWASGGAIAGGVLSFLELAAIAPVVVSGGAAILAVLAIGAAAVAGAVVAGFIGYAVDWFRRLKVQDPETITVSGKILCAGKNTGIPPFADGDWTFNVGGYDLVEPNESGLDMNEIRTRPAPGSGLSQAYPTYDPNFDPTIDPSFGNQPEVLHVEISSQIGNFGAVGSAVGTTAGALGGLAAGAAVCAALGIATLGLGFALCALIVAVAAAVGAIAGAFVGSTIGAGIGAVADWVSDFDRRGKAVQPGCLMTLTGRWVTDMNHQHNEIHDLESAVVTECWPDDIRRYGPKLTAAVGVGRHPSGPDP